MKKSLLAFALISALGASAYAADVQIYGRIDLGLRYTNVDRDLDKPGIDDKNTFEMASGNKTGSRFGLKGTEDLGNGYSVSFVLENGFDADDGTFDSNGDNSIFGREATVHINGPFGTLALGRVAILASDAGSFGIGAGLSSLGTGWGDVGGQNALWGAGFSSRYSNTVTYVTPEFMGTKVYAQYSFGDGTGEEGKASTNRYYGLGVNSNIGNLNLVGIVDSVNRASNGPDATNDEDVWRVIIGGSYDFGVVKPYLAAAFFNNGAISDAASMYSYSDAVKTYGTGLKWNYDGWAVMAGASAPLFGGTFYGTAGYMSAEYQSQANGVRNHGDQNDIDRWLVGFGYEYPLSKRTVLYADAGYIQDSVDAAGSEYDSDPRAVQAAFGMVHYF